MAGMELPVLDKCCFIFHLRTGCIILGVINSMLTFVLGLVLITLAVDVRGAGARAGEGEALSGVLYSILLLLVVLMFLKFLADMLFVWAVYKEKSGIIKKYCIFWIVFLVLFIIGFLKTLFHMGAGVVITLMLFLALNLYYISIIRSYMISINEDGVL